MSDGIPYNRAKWGLPAVDRGDLSNSGPMPSDWRVAAAPVHSTPATPSQAVTARPERHLTVVAPVESPNVVADDISSLLETPPTRVRRTAGTVNVAQMRAWAAAWLATLGGPTDPNGDTD